MDTIIFLYGKLPIPEIKGCMDGGPLKESHMATMAKMIQTEQKTVAYYESKIGFRAKSDPLARELESEKKRMEEEEEE